MKRFLVFVLVVLAGTAVFGYFRGWYSASTASAEGKPGLTFTWDRERFNADMSTAGSKIKSLSQAAVEKVRGKAKATSATQSTIAGKVTSVDPATHTVTLDSDGQSIPLTVPESMPGIDQLVGRYVTVTLEKSGDSLIVRSIVETK